MTTHRWLTAALWLLAGAAAFAVATSWMGQAHSGKVSPWALVAFFWGAAVVSVAIHHLAQGLEALGLYRFSLAPAEELAARLRDRVWRPTLADAPHRLASGLAFMRRHLAAQFALIAGSVPARVQRPFMRWQLAAQFALIAGIVSARLQRAQPVDAIGPDAGAEPLGKRLDLVGQVEPA